MQRISPLILQCAHHRLTFSRPKVMGIVNLHAQSFSTTGRYTDPAAAIVYAKELIADGAAIIDLGAAPTNPYHTTEVDSDTELTLLLPVIRTLIKETDAIISVDTSQPAVMAAVIDAGVHMINDVQALSLPGALSIVAKSQVGLCLMHHKPVSEDLPLLPSIQADLTERIAACLQAGIAVERLCIDPGFGGGSAQFHKSFAQNVELLRDLAQLDVQPKRPLLVGLSHKGFIGRLMHAEKRLPTSGRLSGGLAAALWAAQAGAQIIRTHDVKATVEALNVWYGIIQ